MSKSKQNLSKVLLRQNTVNHQQVTYKKLIGSCFELIHSKPRTNQKNREHN